MSEPPDWLKYEYQIVNHHAKTTSHKTYHWNVLPEEVIYNCGLVTSANEHRVNRLVKRNSENPNTQILIGDRFGADAIAHDERKNICIFVHLY